MKRQLYKLDALGKELEGLPPLHRLAFAAACCERLLPNYNLVREENGWGNPSILRNALNEVWQILQGKQVEVEEIRQLLQACDDAVPNADDVFGSQYDVEAQEAASAICFTLEAYLDATPKNVLKVANCVMETIDAYLSMIKDIQDPSWWDKNSLEQQQEEFSNHPFAMR